MVRLKQIMIFLLCLFTSILIAALPSVPKPNSFLIINAQVADGTGAPLRKANVRVDLSHIVAVGDLTPKKGEPIVDGAGLVLAPGFIDIHNHSADGLLTDPLAESQVAQGITSLVVGPDGESPWPIINWVRTIQELHTAPNVSIFAGHATIRKQAMGQDYKRTATPGEIKMMQLFLGQAMNQQALGLSSGLEYEVGSYSSVDELIALAKVAAEHGGIYMTHIRDEGDNSFQALDEEMMIAERAHIPVEHSHIKLGTVRVHGNASSFINVINEARQRGIDFMADCYPYDAWHANIKVLVPNKEYEHPSSVARGLEDVGGASHVTITEFKPNSSYVGHTLADLAQANHLSDVDMYIRLIHEGDAANTEAMIICQSMIESDIKAFFQQPWVMVASDGGIANSHPRGAGTFPRVLGVYVREQHWLTLPDAIRKMTSLPAQRLSWKDRGVIREGAFADLVLFNPDTIIDRSTYTNPAALPTGIEKVFVNGVLVWDKGKSTSARPGHFLGQRGIAVDVLN
jgi:N-acyl-D-amino-acid deacylase